MKTIIGDLLNELRNDEDYYRSWQANIAMAMYDELERGIAHILETTTRPVPIYIVVEQIKKIANNCLEKTNHLTN